MRYLLLTITMLSALSLTAAVKLSPTPYEPVNYSGKLLTGEYDENITHPDQILGFPIGQRVADPEQIARALAEWEGQTPRIQVHQYATSHEGRPLFYVVISSPEQLKALGTTKENIQRLANPVDLTEAEADEIITDLPSVAWMAYSIHGNESSGADAALTAIYHLIASKEPWVEELLANQVVFIDPMMNPDGRARFAKELQEHRGVAPNVDTQSLLHTGSWPYGRTNHYFFDLNRDFIFLTQPETRGRVEMINQWFPQLMIDGHEMGATDTYLFSPAREPVNPHLPPERKKWGNIFAADQAAAFDENAWRYYTGEWFENLYPGYSNYAEYRGAVHILYEQARIAEDGIKRPDGNVVSYKQSVHHQLVSTYANLLTLAKHSKDMYNDFVAERRQNISSSGPYADRSFAIMPTENRQRLARFIDLLKQQNIAVYQLEESLRVAADTQLGEKNKAITLPVGTIIVPNRQPEARLIATMLEFDANITEGVLKEERHRTLRDGSSLMYDTTAWNLTMMFGLESVMVKRPISRSLKPYEPSAIEPVKPSTDNIAVAVNGLDDASVSFAARVMERGFQVRALDKDAELSGHKLPRGSVVVTKTDNSDWQATIDTMIEESDLLGLKLMPISNGLGEGDLPDWGGSHFRLLKAPKIALVARAGFSSYDVGATWFSLDRDLAIRHTLIDGLNLNYADLRRYNVLILPHNYTDKLSESTYKMVDTWVKQGGTLIATDGSAESVIRNGLSNVSLLQNAFDKAEEFDIALQREWLSNNVEIDLEQVTSNVVPSEIPYPWQSDSKRLPQQELEKRDQWQRKFMPSGAFVAARSDQKHWLTFGTPEQMPLLFSSNPLFMSASESEAVTRIGVFKNEDTGTIGKIAKQVMDEPTNVGWSTVPKGHQAIVRLSGLVWPEAAQRMLNAAHMTRERSGRGQVILFSTQPNFRGSTYLTNRLLLNAIVYGPGLGTSSLIEL